MFQCITDKPVYSGHLFELLRRQSNKQASHSVTIHSIIYQPRSLNGNGVCEPAAWEWMSPNCKQRRQKLGLKFFHFESDNDVTKETIGYLCQDVLPNMTQPKTDASDVTLVKNVTLVKRHNVRMIPAADRSLLLLPEKNMPKRKGWLCPSIRQIPSIRWSKYDHQPYSSSPTER